MARVIVIRITVDNREAINAVKAQREEQKKLNDQIAANARETRNAEAHAARMVKTSQELSHVQQGLTNSFIKGNLAARAISATYISIRDSVRFAIGETAKYELTMARVMAVTGSSRAETLALSDTVFQLSRNVAASTNEIAGTALELAKLGFSGENLKAVLGGVAQLSSTLGDTLEATGQLVGGVVNAFNLSAEQATKVSDKLFVATGRSATNIEGFKVAFSLASAVAEDAGIKFEEFAAAVAALSNQGVRASTIGTGLRNFIAELSKEGSKAQKALGGSIEELGLLGAIERLQSLKLPAGSLIELFGKPGSPVASGLQNAKVQYLDFLGAIEDSEGALKKAGSTINETLIASVIELKNAFIEFFSITSSPAAQGFKNFFNNIAEGIQKQTDATRKLTAFNNFLKENSQNGTNPKDVLRNRGVNVPGGRLSDRELQDLFEQGELLRKARELRSAFDPREEMRSFKRTSLADAPEIVAGKEMGAKTRSLEDMLSDFERLKTNFEVFQTFGGPFDFSKTIREMENLAKAMLQIGERQDAVKVMREIQEIRKQSDSSEKATLGLPQEFEEDSPRIIEDDPKKFERFLKGKEAFEKNQAKEKQKLADADKFKVFIKDLEESLEPVQILIDNLTLSMDALGQSTQLFGEFVVDSFLGHTDAFSDFQDAFGNLAKRFVADLIAMEIRILAFKGALALFSFFAGGGPASPALLPGAPDLLDIAGPTLAANGFDGVVSSPRMFIAGEGGESERVKITPLSKMSNEGGGNTYITVQGDVFDSEKLVDKIALTNERTKTRYV